MKHRQDNVFSLAFLDVMFCGFGAIILFFMIINANTYERREKINYVAQSEVKKIDLEVLEGKKFLAELKNTIWNLDNELVQVRGRTKEIIVKVDQSERQLAQQRRETLTTLQNIDLLKTDLKSLDEASQRLEGGATDAQTQGNKLRYFAGQGQRQYLTGLKMGGERILVLVDSSASMLADRIINVLRFRNLPAVERVRAAKWQQVLYTVDWITTRIPPTSKFQIYAFNETSSPVYSTDNSQWLDAGNVKHLNLAVSSFYRTVPENGTSLYNAFKSIAELSPSPDNIYLLTDGLPTLGKSKTFSTKVSAKKRKKLYRKALEKLPTGIPVNIILFHMEGDPEASSEYWKLAQNTNGAFFSPSKDWP